MTTLRVAWLVTAGLVALHVVLQLLVTTPLRPPDALRQVFNVGAEQNLPTFYNTALLVVLACSMWLVAALLPDRQRQTRRAGWLGAGVAVAAMAADEAAGLHEQIFLAARVRLGGVGVETATFKWVLPGAVFAAGAALVAVVWLRRQPRPIRRGLLLALGLYGTGALAVEAISGVVLKQRGVGRAYHMVTAVEEGLEMGAVLVALQAVWGLLGITRLDRGRAITSTWPHETPSNSS